MNPKVRRFRVRRSWLSPTHCSSLARLPVYYRFGADGTVERTYANIGLAVEDDLYGMTHRVVGDQSVSHYSTILGHQVTTIT